MSDSQFGRECAGRCASACARGATILCALLFAARPIEARQTTDLPCVELGQILIGQAVADADSCVITVPRSDLEIQLLGVRLPEGALVSRITFAVAGTATALIGELALMAGERPRVLRELRTAGFRLTALHSHTSGEAPEIVFAHFHGAGPDARELGIRLRQAMGPPPQGSPIRRQPVIGEYGRVAGIPCAVLAQAVGALEKDAAAGPGSCGVTSDIGIRLEVDGVPLPAAAVTHRFGFRQTPDRTSAVVTASLVLESGAVDAVLAVVGGGGFDVVTLANDLQDEAPRTLTLHVQARGNPLLLAETLRTALATSSQVPPGSVMSGSGGPSRPMR